MPSKKLSRRLSTSAEDIGGDLEKRYLQFKNRDLAKSLAECQVKYQTVLKERNLLQKELMEENIAYKNTICNVKRVCQEGMKHLVSISNMFTDILTEVASVTNRNGLNVRKSDTTTPPHKTHSVKPMISGCTISKPTIKLQRLSENLQTLAENSEPDRNSENSASYTERTVPVISEVVAPSTSTAEQVDMRNVNCRSFFPNKMLQELETDTEIDEIEQNPLDESNTATTSFNQLSTIREESSSLKSPKTESVSVSTSIKRSRYTLSVSESSMAENSFQTHYTSTPIRNSMSNSRVSDESSSTHIMENISRFVTKRRGNGGSDGSTKSVGSPRVILERMQITQDAIKQEKNTRGSEDGNKEQKLLQNTRQKRSAAQNVTYKEPPLNKKLRRLK